MGIWNVGKRGGVVGVAVVGGFSAAVIYRNLLVGAGVFVVAVGLAGGWIPMVLLHHRAVERLQGGGIDHGHLAVGVHRQAHDFPSVVVDEDDLRL